MPYMLNISVFVLEVFLFIVEINDTMNKKIGVKSQ